VDAFGVAGGTGEWQPRDDAWDGSDGVPGGNCCVFPPSFRLLSQCMLDNLEKYHEFQRIKHLSVPKNLFAVVLREQVS
jgi:hypothetical protein